MTSHNRKMAEKKKYNYMGIRVPGRTPGRPNWPKRHNCVNREELIQYYAGIPVRLAKIWSREAKGYLKRGETLDGFQREIVLQSKILRLEKMLADAKRQT
jgi:hypothetical protein